MIPQSKIAGHKKNRTSFARTNHSAHETVYPSCEYTITISTTTKTHNKRGNEINKKTLLSEFSHIELCIPLYIVEKQTTNKS